MLRCVATYGCRGGNVDISIGFRFICRRSTASLAIICASGFVVQYLVLM